MTTTVTVKAHCDTLTTHVEVQIIYETVVTDESIGIGKTENLIMQDGETRDFTVYPGKSIIVTEVPKQQLEVAA